jgi:predicted transcriptional regulator
MKYRSRTEIASQILDAGLDRTTKTRIMYKAFLSYTQLKEYLDILTANGLLEYQKSEGTYRTTAKGKKFLELYNDMGRLITIKKSKSYAHNKKY